MAQTLNVLWVSLSLKYWPWFLLFTAHQQGIPDGHAKFLLELDLLKGREFGNIELTESVWKEMYQKACDTNLTMQKFEYENLRASYDEGSKT